MIGDQELDNVFGMLEKWFMRVTAKLYGILRNNIPGYLHAEGVMVEIPENGTVKDLLSVLEIPESQNVVVAVEGHILTKDDAFKEAACISLLQPLSGG